MSVGNLRTLELPSNVTSGLANMPQIMAFKAPVRSYVILNSRPKPMDVPFGGNRITIPACTDIVRRPPGVQGVFRESERDADGDFIPGSLVLEDLYEWVPELEDDVCFFDSTRAVVHILGIRVSKDGKPSSLASSYALRGLSLLPRQPDKALWHMVAKDGEHRSFIASVQDAYHTISAHDAANAKRRTAGDAPLPGGMEVVLANKLISDYENLVKAKAEEAVAPYKADAELAELEEEIEIEAIAKARAMELATKLAAQHGIDKQRLFDDLMNDPKIRTYAQKQFRFRKKGHLPIDQEKLDAAANAGLSVTDVEKQGSQTDHDPEDE